MDVTKSVENWLMQSVKTEPVFDDFHEVSYDCFPERFIENLSCKIKQEKLDLLSKYEERNQLENEIEQINSRNGQNIEPYCCDQCNINFNTLLGFLKHNRHHPKSIKTYQCEFCNNNYYSETSLNLHKRYHSKEKNYLCNICQEGFVMMSEVLRHERLIHNSKNENFKIIVNENVEKNQRREPQVEKVIFHTLNVEKLIAERNAAVDKEVNNKFAEPEPPEPSNIAMLENLTHFYRYKAQKKLNDRAAKQITTQELISYFIENKNKTNPEKKEKKFQCEKCSAKFAEKFELLQHLLIHDDEQKYECFICYEKFNSLAALNAHKKNHKKFSCEVCDKEYSTAYYLMEHRRSHQGIRPHHCQICDKYFSFRGAFRLHMQRHNSDGSDKNYTCDTCQKCFKHPSDLTRHKAIHSAERNYTCDICGQSYKDISTLKRHQFLHTGLRPYVCQFCGKSFIRSTHMRVHIRKQHPTP